jgi:hypothetical protein
VGLVFVADLLGTFTFCLPSLFRCRLFFASSFFAHYQDGVFTAGSTGRAILEPSIKPVVAGAAASSTTKPVLGASAPAARAVVIYSLADVRARVQAKNLSGLTSVSLEVHLNDDEFKEALGCTRDEWASVPAWKKETLRKKAGLF